MESYILLENIEIFAKHGVFEQENRVGNTFIINLKIKKDLSKASVSDSLEDTLNYAEAYHIIEEEMAVTSKLMEHVAGRIIRRIKQLSENVEQVELKISKLNPPVKGQIKYASVILKD